MKRSGAKEDHLAQTLILDRANKSLCKRVGVWCLKWSEHNLHTRILNHRLELLREFGIPVEEEKSFSKQEPVDAVDDVACDLRHEWITRVWR